MTQDADFTGWSTLAATAHGLAMGSVSLEVTATLRPQAQDRQPTLNDKGLDRGPGPADLLGT